MGTADLSANYVHSGGVVGSIIDAMNIQMRLVKDYRRFYFYLNGLQKECGEKKSYEHMYRHANLERNVFQDLLTSTLLRKTKQLDCDRGNNF